VANTGYYVKIERNGEPTTLDITELDDQELHDFFIGRKGTLCAFWAATLAAWIRDNHDRIPEGT
jgi:hypothetical protein